jgi:aldehyde dehydrogenase (NAD+)
MDYAKLIERQRAYYATGATRLYADRLKALKELSRVLKLFEARLYEALEADLNKSSYEAYLTEIAVVQREIRFFTRHLKGWMKDKRRPTTAGLFFSRSYVSPEPYGVVLIVSPWNYPVHLCLMPLIGAIAAGNCIVLKTSSKCPRTGAVLGEMLSSAFPDEYITLVQDSREQCHDLFSQTWDYIFFTGSKAGGRAVMSAAVENLIPMTLELGGKNPVLIDPTADLKRAARRIAFGKCLNAGQTCIAPDYVLVHASIRDAFVAEYEKALEEFFPKGDHAKLVSLVDEASFQRLSGLMEGETMPLSHETDPERRYMEPTVLVDITPESPVMQQEVFGPILPLITWTDLNWCMDVIHSYDKPLALYIFTGDKTIARRLMTDCSFGCGCVNDTMMQAMGSHLGFGGVGGSGMGQYHGVKSFETFTHYRSMLERRAWPEQKLRYFPYTKWKHWLLKALWR